MSSTAREHYFMNVFVHYFQEHQGSKRAGNKAHSFQILKEFSTLFKVLYYVCICIVIGVIVKLYGDYLSSSLYKNVCEENGSVYVYSKRSEFDKN